MSRERRVKHVSYTRISKNCVLITVVCRCKLLNLLTPNVNYIGRTASPTSKVSFYIFIQQIYVLNILNVVNTLRFFLFKMQFVSLF